MDAGEVHRLVDIADAGRAVAEVGDRDLVEPAQLRRQRGADGVRDLRGDGAPCETIRRSLLTEVRGHVPPAAVDVVAARRRSPIRMSRGVMPTVERDADVPVVREQPVVARAQRRGGADLCGLVAFAAVRDRALAHALEQPLPHAHGAGQQHLVLHLEKLLVGEAERLRRFLDRRHAPLPVLSTMCVLPLDKYVVERRFRRWLRRRSRPIPWPRRLLALHVCSASHLALAWSSDVVLLEPGAGNGAAGPSSSTPRLLRVRGSGGRRRRWSAGRGGRSWPR